MAKRTRGSNRPGQRHAERHGSARPLTRPESRTSLSASEEARAAELESQIVAQERAAEANRARGRNVRSTEFTRPGRTGGQGLLAARAAEEYGYVVRDVRRIIFVGGALAAILAVVFVIVDVMRLVSFS
jgi:hypothetical protein